MHALARTEKAITRTWVVLSTLLVSLAFVILAAAV
jgi:hypothetical protein